MKTAAFRASAPSATAQPQAGQPQLGPLAELPGTWVGRGFNLVSLPDEENNRPFRVKLNATRETLNFTAIGVPIPSRGSAQDDIEFLGLHYLQQVNDANTLEARHLEPGLWLNVPATTAPPEAQTIVRLATIPHGVARLAQGNFLDFQGRR